jgi:hypothetical protein
MPDIAFIKPALPKHGAMVLLVTEDATPAGLHPALDKATGGGITRALEAASFKGSKGQTATLWAPLEGIGKVVAIGLGKTEEVTAERMEAAGGTLYGLIAKEREAMVAAEGLPAPLAASLGLAHLRGLHQRIEHIHAPHDVVCSRAFASLADFVHGSVGALAPGGVWLALKGKMPDDEVAQLGAAAQVFHVEPLQVPGLDAQRCLVWMHRTTP